MRYYTLGGEERARPISPLGILCSRKEWLWAVALNQSIEACNEIAVRNHIT